MSRSAPALITIVPDEAWWVTVEPGDYIAFTPPWDGRYDT
jgi:hypothetical protein